MKSINELEFDMNRS